MEPVMEQIQEIVEAIAEEEKIIEDLLYVPPEPLQSVPEPVSEPPVQPVFKVIAQPRRPPTMRMFM
jgi:hypothetical protein